MGGDSLGGQDFAQGSFCRWGFCDLLLLHWMGLMCLLFPSTWHGEALANVCRIDRSKRTSLSQFPWDYSSLSTGTASQGPPQSWTNQAAGLPAKSGSSPGPSVHSQGDQALPLWGPWFPTCPALMGHLCLCTVPCGHAQVLTSKPLSSWMGDGESRNVRARHLVPRVPQMC